MHPRLLLACASLLPTACSGPATILHNPDGHRVFVDGREVPRPSPRTATRAAAAGGQQLPFRYYGISRWDAVPADVDDLPDWDLQPASAAIDLAPPVSMWLFPLDFPLEVARRALVGSEDHPVAIVLPPTPPEQIVPTEVPPAGLGQLLERAETARSRR
ncbi:MAG: hypothetical protein JNM25_15995 [Planctomycetes bacterium]|nr:hypothetical protein [Planctomycetota bacterium]